MYFQNNVFEIMFKSKQKRDYFSHVLTSFHRACERTKSKQKQNQVTSYSNWQCFLLFDLAHKECNYIIKVWLHCLTSESNRRFLFDNILMFGSTWYLVTAQIQFSLIKKNKDWTSTTLANPRPLRPIKLIFALTLSKWMSYVYHTF